MLEEECRLFADELAAIVSPIATVPAEPMRLIAEVSKAALDQGITAVEVYLARRGVDLDDPARTLAAVQDVQRPIWGRPL